MQDLEAAREHASSSAMTVAGGGSTSWNSTKNSTGSKRFDFSQRKSVGFDSSTDVRKLATIETTTTATGAADASAQYMATSQSASTMESVLMRKRN